MSHLPTAPAVFAFSNSSFRYPVVRKVFWFAESENHYTEPSPLALRILGRTKKFVKLNFKGKEKKIKIRVINYNGTETEAIWIKEDKVWVVACCYALNDAMARRLEVQV